MRLPRPLPAPCGALALALVLAAAPAARAGEVVPAGGAGDGRWVSIGVLTGSLQFDDELADYRWQVDPRMTYGGQALAGWGRLAAGVRVLSATTEQELGLPGVAAPEVRTTSVEMVAHGRLARMWGTDVMATGSVGWLHLGYQPDQVSVEVVPGTTVEVGLDPIDEWIAGAGVALRRPLFGPWVAGLEVDRRLFRMDTAHRDGDTIEFERQTFGDWGARLELAWLHRR
jgi:hypothetical protein